MEKPVYVSSCLARTLHPSLLHLLWTLYFEMEVETKDYLQIFQLRKDGKKQIIIHKQEEPEYKRTYETLIPDVEPIEEKVYIIQEGENQTMIFASEY